jgi:hypothetical protein
MSHWDFPPSPCPFCGIILNFHVATSGEDEGVPMQPGDVTICAGCGAILIFESDKVRKPSDGEKAVILKEIAADLSKQKPFLN